MRNSRYVGRELGNAMKSHALIFLPDVDGTQFEQTLQKPVPPMVTLSDDVQIEC